VQWRKLACHRSRRLTASLLTDNPT
jgi:hypothetical protein